MSELRGAGEAVTGQADLGAGILTISRRIANKAKNNSKEAANPGPSIDNALNTSDPSKSIISSKADLLSSAFRNRTVIIEPAFALMFALVISSFQLRSQYTYWAIGEKYNLSALLANSSTGGGQRSDCDSSNYTNSSIYLLEQKVQAETAEFNLILDLSADVPGLIVVLFMGPWTDNYGRKPALIMPLVGILLQCTVYVIQQVASLSLYVMIVGSVINACTGGMGTFVNACFSYYTDTIPSSRLGRRVITADLIYGLVLALMQVVMGYLIETLGFVYPYIIVMTGHLVNLLYVIFFVPESKKAVTDKKSISPKYILNSFKVITKERPEHGRRVLLLGIAARCAIVFFVWPRRSIQPLFLLNSPLCWSSRLIGIFSAFSSVFANLCQLFMTLVLLHRLREHGCLILSAVCGTLSTLWLALSSTTWMVFLVPVIGFSQGATLPILRAILSTTVSPDEQGALFASLSSTTSVVDMVGGIVFNLLYASTLLFFKGTAFLVMAVGLVVALVLLCFFRKDYIRKIERESWLYHVPKTEIYAIT